MQDLQSLQRKVTLDVVFERAQIVPDLICINHSISDRVLHFLERINGRRLVKFGISQKYALQVKVCYLVHHDISLFLEVDKGPVHNLHSLLDLSLFGLYVVRPDCICHDLIFVLLGEPIDKFDSLILVVSEVLHHHRVFIEGHSGPLDARLAFLVVFEDEIPMLFCLRV